MTRPKPHNLMRAALAAFLISAFMLALFWLMSKPVPTANEQLVVFMLGQLATLASMAVAFYFGTSKSSADKTEIIAQTAPPGAPPLEQGCRCQSKVPGNDADTEADLRFGNREP